MDRTKQALRLLVNILDAEQGYTKSQLYRIFQKRDMRWYHLESEARCEAGLALVNQMQSNLESASDERWAQIVKEFNPDEI